MAKVKISLHKDENIRSINFLNFGTIKEVCMKEEIVPGSTLTFRNHKTHTPEEILNAGGATVFGYKSGKNNLELIQALHNAPVAEPFTEEEWEQTLQQLEKNK